MGWKAVKEHYQIEHFVQVTEAGICIGSPYIHNIIVIGKDGKLAKRYDGRMNDDLARYQHDFESDPETLRRLIELPDTFSSAITIYTYKGGEILEKACEKPEWPHVTHDGQMIYDNTFSTDKAKVVAWAKRDADLGIKMQRRNLKDLEAQVEDYRNRLSAEIANREHLETDYPDVVVEPED